MPEDLTGVTFAISANGVEFAPPLTLDSRGRGDSGLAVMTAAPAVSILVADLQELAWAASVPVDDLVREAVERYRRAPGDAAWTLDRWGEERATTIVEGVTEAVLVLRGDRGTVGRG